MTVGKASAIASVEELRAAAAALEAAVLHRYRRLNSWWRKQGDSSLATVFARLMELEQAHAAALGSNLGTGPDPGPPSANTPNVVQHNEAAWWSTLLTPYRALSLAVCEKQRFFAFYTDAAAHATMRELREFAEDLARAELDHCQILRQARRAAFHKARCEPPVLPPADLRALERQRASWEAEAAAATDQAAQLRALSRNAERYLAIAEQTKSEVVLAAAQRLAAEALHRMAVLRARSRAF